MGKIYSYVGGLRIYIKGRWPPSTKHKRFPI